MKNYFQKSIKKFMLSGIDRYDDNVKKILIRNPQNQREKIEAGQYALV